MIFNQKFLKEGLIEPKTVTPAQAGVHEFQWVIDSHLRGNGFNQTFPKLRILQAGKLASW